MKKIVSLLLAVAMLLCATAGLCVSAYADDEDEYYVSGDFEYRLLEDGTAEITDYLGSATDLVIPSELDGYTVTSIGGRDEEISYDNVTGTVDYLHYSAFYYCDSLISVSIPSCVTSIEDRPFDYCDNLSNITVDSKNENYFSQDGVLFSKDKELIQYPSANERTSYVIPSGTISIGESAFTHSRNLTNVTIPNGLKSIGSQAFWGARELSSVVLPESVIYIGSEAFGETGLESIYVLSRNCEIIKSSAGYWGAQTFGDAVVYGYRDSTAQAYAESVFGAVPSLPPLNDFIALDELKDNIIADGTDEVYFIGSENGTSIHCTNPLDEFISVTINGELIDEANYTLTDGSTILTFKSEYLDAFPDSVNVVALNFASETVYSILKIETPIIEEPEAEASTEDTTEEEPTTEEATTDESTTEAVKDESTTTESTTAKPATETTTKAEITQPSATEKDDTEKSPSTGGESKGLLAFAAIALAGGAVMLVKKKEQG